MCLTSPRKRPPELVTVPRLLPARSFTVHVEAAAIAVYLAEAEARAFGPSFAESGGVWTIPLG